MKMAPLKKPWSQIIKVQSSPELLDGWLGAEIQGPFPQDFIVTNSKGVFNTILILVTPSNGFDSYRYPLRLRCRVTVMVHISCNCFSSVRFCDLTLKAKLQQGLCRVDRLICTSVCIGMEQVHVVFSLHDA